MWRDFGKREIDLWPRRQQWVFYWRSPCSSSISAGTSRPRSAGGTSWPSSSLRPRASTRACAPGATSTATAERLPRGDARGDAVEAVERGADVHHLADEDRRVPLGVARGLGLAERQHQVHEVGRLVALEHGHELLVVDPERVRRVVVDRRPLVADAHMLVHRTLTVGLGERVPRAHLHERVDDQVGRALREDLPGPPRVRVRGGLRGRQVVVGDVHPAGERRRVQRRAELAEVVVALGDLPEEEVAVGPDPGRRVHVQGVEPRRELVHGLGERILRRRALLDGQAAPLGPRLEERVGDVLAARLAAHEPQFTCPSGFLCRCATGARLLFGRPFG